jgi:hypothetical protein
MYPVRLTQPKLYFSKIMEFSHYDEYGVLRIYTHMCINELAQYLLLLLAMLRIR